MENREKLQKLTHLAHLVLLSNADGVESFSENEFLINIIKREGFTCDDLSIAAQMMQNRNFVYPQDNDTKLLYLSDLIRMSMVDGEIHPNEAAYCKLYAIQLGFHREAVDNMIEFIMNKLKKSQNTDYTNTSFDFKATRYEEWQNGCCISSGDIDTMISFIVPKVYANYVYFTIDRKYMLNIDDEIYFPKQNTAKLADGRIQFANNSSDNPNKPIVCHLFFDNSKLNCIRFAMTNPDRLIEFYGAEYFE